MINQAKKHTCAVCKRIEYEDRYIDKYNRHFCGLKCKLNFERNGKWNTPNGQKPTSMSRTR